MTSPVLPFSALWDIHTHRFCPGNPVTAILNRRVGKDRPTAVEGVPCSVGIHPWDLTEENAEHLRSLLSEAVETHRFVAIGEAGLDRLARAPLSLQRQVFHFQAQLAERLNLPLIIHGVRTADELIAVKRDLKPEQAWIWHGFRGKSMQCVQLLRHGFFLSFGERYAAEAMRIVPAERLFLETDESEVPIGELLHRAAEVRGEAPDKLREQLLHNIRTVFGLPVSGEK